MQKLSYFICLLALSIPSFATDLTENFIKGTPKISSMSQLAFGPQGILFIGDSKSATLFAIALDDKTAPVKKASLKIADLEGKIAALLGAKKSDVMVHDIAVNPLSKNIYLAVSRGRAKGDSYWKLPNDLDDATILIRIKNGKAFEEVSLNNIKYSQVTIPNPIDKKKKNWRGKFRPDVITDIAYANGQVYVSGLSNEEFASTFRKIPFPFSNQVTSSSIEIYHAAHGQYETKSPIRTFLPYNLNGKPHILAAYLCTPLVTIPEDQLKNGQHVKGRTIAELGMGNMPLDMVVYKKDDKDYILMANTTRNAMKFSIEDIANTKVNLTTKTQVPFASEGVKYISFPRLLQQLANYDDKNLLVVMRMPNGSLVMGLQPIKWL
ncbi:hypothetical protein [Microscilla marina]|uniref:Lipoprotein n=1 Tax=Microscilla marina ATCC 23134 TaxID=313606 RepID=A1ZZR0_MICM2|nr:hypothetical protein [Microscilla marina]EAY24118.1 hypothetical protein M23134_06035 [Microscilla marina ATCC 23134]